MDCSLPGSSAHGIFQARILEWVPLPIPRDLPDPGIEPASPPLQTDSLPSEALFKTVMKKLIVFIIINIIFDVNHFESLY